MDDNRRPSPSSSSSSSAAVGNSCRRVRRHVEEENGEAVDLAGACTGRSCRSCTAGAIADCVAVCCCPCAVVSLLALAFVKLPWAVARKCLWGRRKRNRRRRLEEKRKCTEGGGGGISGSGRAEEETTSDSVLTGDLTSGVSNDRFSAEIKMGELDFWSEVGVGQLCFGSFGRVSYSGIPFQEKGNLGNSNS
ncbi:hypothetical protein OROHE_027165 [Orobanche hederae]